MRTMTGFFALCGLLGCALSANGELGLQPDDEPPNQTAASPHGPKSTPSGPMAETADNPLKADSRLDVDLTLNLRNPRIQDLLERFGAATGLVFRGDENVDFATPVYHAMTTAEVPVWQLMGGVAEAKSIKGQWEKQGDGGYLLKGGGTKLVPPAPTAPMVDMAANPLTTDSRLRAKVTFDLRHARAQELLDHFARATGVVFRGDRNVDFGATVFEAVTVDEAPVWRMMMQVAESPAIRGQWEKQPDGSYLLKGGPKLEPAGSTWRWWLAGSALALLLVGAALLTYRLLMAKRAIK